MAQVGYFLSGVFLHGMYMLIYDGFKALLPNLSIFKPLAWLITALSVSFAWIFFRSESLQDAILISQKFLAPGSFSPGSLTAIHTPSIQYGNFSMLFILISTLFMFTIEKITNPLLTDLNSRRLTDLFIFVISVLAIIFYGVFHRTSFIYFQF